MYDKLMYSYLEAMKQGNLLRIALLTRNTPKEFYDQYDLLIPAVWSRRPDIVEFLLQQKIDLNNIDAALYYATLLPDEDTSIELIKLCIGAGANVNTITRGYLPLKNPCLEGRMKVVKLLLDAGADPNVRELDKSTAIMHAASRNQKEVVELLIEKRAYIDAQDVYGRTALIYACADGYVETAKLLLEAGADPYMRDADGKTALDYAYRYHRDNLVPLLNKY